MLSQRPLRVLIAEDSLVTLKLLTHIINAAPDMKIIGEAMNGRQAIRLAQELRPDIILMDMIMPELTGVEAIQEIMSVQPVPIVAVSAQLSETENDLALQAIRAGALTALPKPPGPHVPKFQDEADNLLNTLRAMSTVHVIHHRRPSSTPAQEKTPVWRERVTMQAPPQIVAIVSSTGGPAALAEVLRGLPADFGLPVVIVQHIASDFVPSLAQHLSGVSRLPISIARAMEQIKPGNVYIAPGEAHLRLTADRYFSLDRTPGLAQFMPSGNILLESIAKSYKGQAIGVILTGMGNDGTAGLRQMYDAGAFTIAQDESTSTVYGMPKAALEAGAVCQTLPLLHIPQAITALAGKGI